MNPVKSIDLRVSDIKQYFYCPRVVYHTYLTPIPRPVTAPMQAGSVKHEVLTVLERRRTLKRYGIEGGKRAFHVVLEAPSLGLSGVLDLLIETESHAFPVEFKHTLSRVPTNAKYQLTAYAMMVEESLGKPVERGFIYRIPQHSITTVLITAALRRRTEQGISAMRQMLAMEQMPPPTPQRGKCTDCEFRRFCRDVL